MKTKQGVNPVTIRPQGVYANGASATIGRMHLGVGGEVMKLVQVATVNEQAQEPMSLAIIPEEQFIAAMGHLFPHGELQHTHWESPPSADEQFNIGYRAALAQVANRLKTQQLPAEFVDWLSKELDRVDTETGRQVRHILVLVSDDAGETQAVVEVPQELISPAALQRFSSLAEQYDQRIDCLVPHARCETAKEVLEWIAECNGDDAEVITEDPEWEVRYSLLANGQVYHQDTVYVEGETQEEAEAAASTLISESDPKADDRIDYTIRFDSVERLDHE